MEKLKNNFESFLSILMILPIFTLNTQLNYDFYFIYMHGKTIIENGFITQEPLSMHSQLDFMPQQWLVAIIFYFLYNFLGAFSVNVFILIIEASTIFVLYKVLNLICNNKTLSKILTFPTSLMIVLFGTQRPLTITFLVIVIMFYFLIKYTQTNKIKYLLPLPLISALTINLQAAMWPFLFILLLPFFAELKIFEFKNIYTDKYNKIPLLIITICMFLCGFINPYGLNAMTYTFRSISKHDIGIFEMMSPSLSNGYGILFILFLFSTIILVFYNKTKINIRYIFLYFGCVILSYYALRNFIFLGFATSVLYSHLLRKTDIKVVLSKIFGYYEIYIPIITIFCILCSLCTMKKLINPEPIDTYDIFAYLSENYEIDDKTIYAGYDDGSYAEFLNMRAYMDTRMEVYLKQQNHKKDYIKERYELCNGDIYYKDFLNNYDFDYVLTKENDVLYNKMQKDSANYELIYSDGSHDLYVNIEHKNNLTK